MRSARTGSFGLVRSDRYGADGMIFLPRPLIYRLLRGLRGVAACEGFKFKMSHLGSTGTPAQNVAPVVPNAHFADLIERIATHQSREAFSELFAYFAPRVKSFVMRLGASEAEAEEIAQDALVNVWRKADQFDRSRARPSTWIFTIARNRRIDILRRHQFTEFDLTDPILQQEEPEQPDDALGANQQEEHVRYAIEALPQEQRELVHLAFYSDWSHAAIAEKTGLPLGTVKSRLRLAFARLRDALNNPF